MHKNKRRASASGICKRQLIKCSGVRCEDDAVTTPNSQCAPCKTSGCVCRVCESCARNVSNSSAWTARDGVCPEIQTIVAEHAQKGQIRQSRLRLSEQAAVICRHSQPSGDTVRGEIARMTTGMRVTQDLWVAYVD